MEFRTIVKIPAPSFSVSYRHSLLMIGSCFVENIGNKLSENKFNAQVNPFGVLYNPLSIESSLRDLVRKKEFRKEDLFFHEGLFHSFSHHSRFSAPTEEECLEKINGSLNKIRIAETDYLFLTFGTSYVYELKSTLAIISNCHKLPEKLFNRKRLEVSTIVERYTDLLRKIYEINPNIELVFSVSPIRHWKDGAHENQVSKSVLHIAIDKLQERFPRIYYFPSYEIVMDELRDYRFYASDMNHISDMAIDYIWERFRETFFNRETIDILKKWQKIKQALHHKPFNPDSPQYRSFINKNKIQLLELKEQCPDIEIEKELDELKSKAG